MRAINRAIEIFGSQREFAERIGVTQGLVSRWARGGSVHQRHFRAIQKATRGKVKPIHLLDDELRRPNGG
jgi:DNA-binding transcriptional regulator YdaS (Cro superfamily)